MHIIAQAPRILIREFAPEELDLLVTIYADERLTEYIKKQTPDDSRKRFYEALAEYKNGSGLGRWGVFNIDDNDFVGVCVMKQSLYEEAPSIELGFRICFGYWGLGIGTEVVKTLITYGFDKVQLKELYAVTHPDNTASQRVLEKAGLKREGNVFWDEKNMSIFRIRNNPV
jgi:ribosomal-protein-alanine N-acetyltransferase